MKIKSVSLSNITSYRDPSTFHFYDDLNIIIGPNGGGKTNLLKAIDTFYHAFLYEPLRYSNGEFLADTSGYYNNIEGRVKSNLGKNDTSLPSKIEITFRTTLEDEYNIKTILENEESLLKEFKDFSWLQQLIKLAKNLNYTPQDITFTSDDLANPNITVDTIEWLFLAYLKSSEWLFFSSDKKISNKIQFPICFMNTNRDAVLVDSISYSDSIVAQANDNKRNSNFNESNSKSNIIHLRLSWIYSKSISTSRNNRGVDWLDVFNKDEDIIDYREFLRIINFEFVISRHTRTELIEILQYSRDGSVVSSGRLSSGEKALLSIIHTVIGYNIRNGTFLIDEPELHLHPRWQKTLLKLFKSLQERRGLQFIICTHSPSFISPDCISDVFRIFKKNNTSQIISLRDTGQIKKSKLLQLINAQNNEKIFFADYVVLVEGITDRIFFEQLIQKEINDRKIFNTVEVIDVDGKTNFGRYKEFLDALEIPYSVIADRDYLEQIGSQEIKNMLSLNYRKMKEKTDDKKSKDAVGLIEAVLKGMFEDAINIALYIRGRYLALKEDIAPEQQKVFNSFIEDKYQENIFVLKKGELENYLPSIAKGSTEKLIEWINDPNLTYGVNQTKQEEIEIIISSIIKKISIS